jgi:hypothetical protein
MIELAEKEQRRIKKYRSGFKRTTKNYKNP